MRICFTSDTHGHHLKLDIPTCDLLIHCGDFSNNGTNDELFAFNAWVRRLKASGRIKRCYVVPGNHDRSLDGLVESEGRRLQYEAARDLLDEVDDVWINSGTTIDGISFWGFSFIPPCGTNFGFQRTEEVMARLVEVPLRRASTDVFVSHGPPWGVLDVNLQRHHMGCGHLLGLIKKLKPRYHFFGHVHGNCGVSNIGETVCCNVASGGYEVKTPIILDITQK